MNTRLDTGIGPDINFTVHNDAVLTLVNMAKCSIALDISNEIIIFNSQCYDHKIFEIVRFAAMNSNAMFSDSGYRDWTRTSAFKDPKLVRYIHMSMLSTTYILKRTYQYLN